MGKTILEFFLTDIDYETDDSSGKPYLRLFGTTEKGGKVVAFDYGLRPYFWVMAEEGRERELAKKIEKVRVKGSVRVNEVVEASVKEKKFLRGPVKAIRVKINHPRAEKKVRREVKKLKGFKEVKERGVSYYRRYLMDEGLFPFTKVRVKGKTVERKGYRTKYQIKVESIKKVGDLYKDPSFLVFDLEAYNYRINPRAEKDPIIMISIASNLGVKKVMTWKEVENEEADVYESEMEMLKAFISLVKEKQPDVVVGYNSDSFDFEYLRKRARKYGLKLKFGLDRSKMKFVRRGRTYRARIKGMTHVDLYPFIKRVMGRTLETGSYDLGSVSEEVLGEKKEELDWEKIWRKWEEGGEALRKLYRYGKKDVELTKKLFEETKPLQLELTRLIGLPLFDITRMGFSQFVEWYLMREAKKENELIPNRPDRKEIRKRRAETFIGGYVYQPKPGLYENIVVADYRSLYPSIIFSHHISPSTLGRGKNQFKSPELDGKSYKFSKEETGFIPKILKNLIDRRARVKEVMRNTEEGTTEYRILSARSMALKTLSNSFYGYFGFAPARWYSRECARSTTAWGREYIKKTIEWAKEAGFKVIYADTDSCFLVLPKDKEERDVFQFIKKINKKLPGGMKLEFEGLYPKGIFVSKKKEETGAKKKYALMDENGKLVIKGFEYVRRDWADIAKETQKKVLETILKGEKEEAVKIIRKTIKDIKNQKVDPKKLAIYTQLKKKIDEYESIGPHVMAAKKAKEAGYHIEQGSIIRYIVTREGGDRISDRSRILREVKEENLKYDPEYYIRNQLMPAVMRIMNVIGYSKVDVLGKGQTKLGRF